MESKTTECSLKAVGCKSQTTASCIIYSQGVSPPCQHSISIHFSSGAVLSCQERHAKAREGVQQQRVTNSRCNSRGKWTCKGATESFPFIDTSTQRISQTHYWHWPWSSSSLAVAKGVQGKEEGQVGRRVRQIAKEREEEQGGGETERMQFSQRHFLIRCAAKKTSNTRVVTGKQ